MHTYRTNHMNLEKRWDNSHISSLKYQLVVWQNQHKKKKNLHNSLWKNVVLLVTENIHLPHSVRNINNVRVSLGHVCLYQQVIFICQAEQKEKENDARTIKICCLLLRREFENILFSFQQFLSVLLSIDHQQSRSIVNNIKHICRNDSSTLSVVWQTQEKETPEGALLLYNICLLHSLGRVGSLVLQLYNLERLYKIMFG